MGHRWVLMGKNMAILAYSPQKSKAFSIFQPHRSKSSKSSSKMAKQIWGVPKKWMVYFMKNPSRKWMMTRGNPMTKRKAPYRTNANFQLQHLWGEHRTWSRSSWHTVTMCFTPHSCQGENLTSTEISNSVSNGNGWNQLAVSNLKSHLNV